MQQLVWTKRDCTCLPASSDHMIPFHQPKQLYWNMISELPIKLPIASSCQELTKCSCKKGCTRRCKCLRSEHACTALCNCACQQYITVRKTTVFQLVQYMCRNGQLSISYTDSLVVAGSNLMLAISCLNCCLKPGSHHAIFVFCWTQRRRKDENRMV